MHIMDVKTKKSSQLFVNIRPTSLLEAVKTSLYMSKAGFKGLYR